MRSGRLGLRLLASKLTGIINTKTIRGHRDSKQMIRYGATMGIRSSCMYCSHGPSMNGSVACRRDAWRGNRARNVNVSMFHAADETRRDEPQPAKPLLALPFNINLLSETNIWTINRFGVINRSSASGLTLEFVFL